MEALKNIFRRFRKTQAAPVRIDLPVCFVAMDIDTKIESLFYYSDSGRFSVDGHSNTFHHTLVGNVPCHDLLEAEPAEHVKRKIIKYYKNKNIELPENFQFLKAYDQSMRGKQPPLRTSL